MLIYKCDICKKEIKERVKMIETGTGFSKFCFCPACGKPLSDFLKKKQLLDKKVGALER